MEIITLKEQLKQQLKLLPETWDITPVRNKEPYMFEWQKKVLSRQEIIDEIDEGRCNGLGLKTGVPSGGLLAIDFDGLSATPFFEQLFGRPVSDLPTTVEFSSGRPGRTQKLYQIPEQYWTAIKTKKFRTGTKDDDGKEEQLELRWSGLQSVVAGVHPITGSYHWVNSPDTTPIAEAPAWLIEKMLVDVPLEKHKTTYKPRNSISDTDRSKLARELLTALNPTRADAPYDEWLSVGMALHSTGDDSLVDDWDAWSQQSKKYRPGECHKKWNSFNSTGISLGTLIHLAKQDGWKSTMNYTENNPKDSDTFKLELQQIEDTTDFEEQVRLIALFCSKYRISRKDLDAMLKRRSNTKKASSSDSCFVSLGDILKNESTAVDWVIPRLVPRKDTALIGGDPGSGKTTLAYAMALAVVTGGEFLGDQVTQGKVLLVQAEKRWSNLAGKLEPMGFTPDMEPYFQIMTEFSLDNLELLENKVASFRPDFIIVDSIAAINVDRGVAPGSVEYADPIYKINDLVQKYNSSCLFIHHLNKNDAATGISRFRDTTALTGAVSVCIILDYIKKKSLNKKGYTVDLEDTHRTLSIVKSGVTSMFSLDIEMDTETYQWTNHGEVGTTKEEMQATTSMKERILNILSMNPAGLTGVEIKETLGISTDSEYSSMKKALVRLKESRSINCKVNPKKHSSRLYTPSHALCPRMSPNLTQTYTTHTLQKGDSIQDVSYVPNDTSPNLNTLSPNGNAYQERNRGKLGDKLGDTHGRSVELPEIGRKVKVDFPGSMLHKKLGRVTGSSREFAPDGQSLQLINVALLDGRNVSLQLSQLELEQLPVNG